MQLSVEMSMLAVSRQLGESDSTLWRIFHHYVNMAVDRQIDLRDVRRIAVDETACKRGHHYVTVFTDLDTGQVILVEEGRKKEVFSRLYGWLFDKGGHPSKIELFSMDMSISYQAGRRDYFANSQEVFDRFHIKKVVNQAMDKVRKTEVKTCEELKKTKYIWLKNEQSLTEKQQQLLYQFLDESTLDTAKAYQLKVGFDTLWNVQQNAVEPLLNTWMDKALELALKPFTALVNTLENHYLGIVASMKTGITNAISEGLNSIIQMVKSRARGYRNIENFKAMIYCVGNDFNFKFHSF